MADSAPPADSSAAGGLRGEGLERLLDIARHLNAEARPDAVLEAIVDSLVAVTGADRGVLFLRGEDGTLTFSLARDRNGAPVSSGPGRLCHALIEDAVAKSETRLVGDTSLSEQWGTRPTVQDLDLRTMLAVPLKTNEGVVGAIYVDSHFLTRAFSEADVPLVEAFAALAASAVERVRLQRAASDRDRMRRQLRFASEIQRTFLLPRFPALDDLEGALAYVPALEVGGDFYDVLRLPGGRVALLVGDVSGKGVPGALFGARLLADVRYEALLHDDVAETLTALNRLVCAHATRGMFVTLLFLLVDPVSRKASYGNAGHPPPLVRSADGKVTAWDAPSGIPLGILTDAAYEGGERRLEEGETLLLATDGVMDAVRADGVRFGAERTVAVVAESGGAPASVVEDLIKATAAFAGRRRQADDQTLLAFAWR